jgi:hypothetical protein
VLLQVAEILGGEVGAFIPQPTFASLETGSRAQAEGTDEDDLRAGTLIGAAVADELAGIQGAVESLMDWLADPARFSANWTSAPEQTLGETKRSAQRSARQTVTQIDITPSPNPCSAD